MKRVYIDLGCHNGQSINDFFNWYSLVDPKAKEYEVYGFEPNDSFSKYWGDISLAHPNVAFLQQAAWSSDCKLNFSQLDQEKDISSTVMAEKRDYDPEKIREVEAIDFSKFLSKFTDYDKVIVKMDIEGAEFPVLEKLISDGTVGIIDLLLLEWHAHKMKPNFGDRKANIIAQLSAAGVEVRNWS